MTNYTDSIGDGDQHLLLVVSETGTSVANNTSTVTAELYLKRDSGSGAWSNYTTNTWSMTINGTKYSGSGTYDLRGAGSVTLIGKKTLTIAHAANGTKTISISAAFKDPNGGGIGSGSISTTKALTTLPQAPSTPSNHGASVVGQAGFTGNFTSAAQGGSAITGSTMQVSLDPTFATGVSTFTGGAIAANTAGTIPATGLTPNSTYSFRFKVTNSQGDSGWSAVATVTLAASGAPHVASIPKWDASGFYVICTPPFNVSAGSVTSYTITRTVSGPGAPAPVTWTTTTPTNNFDALVLVAGQAVSYRATALIAGTPTGSSPTVTVPFGTKTAKAPFWPMFNSTFVPLAPFADTQRTGHQWANKVTNPSFELGVSAGYVGIPGTAGVITQLAAHPNAGATAWGTIIRRLTWTTATSSTTGAGDTLPAIPVVAGQNYSFGIGHVKPSIANKLQLSVDWKDASNALISNSPASVITMTAGQLDEGGVNFVLLNLTAPALAVTATMKLLTGAGGAVWSVNSYLETDAWIAVTGATLPPLNLWGNTLGPAILSSTAPLGWRTFAQGDTSGLLSGSTVQVDSSIALNDTFGHFDVMTVYGTSQVQATAGHRVGSSSAIVSRMALAYPTANYFGAIDVMTDNSTLMAAEIEWYDASLNLLSRVQGAVVTTEPGVPQTLTVSGVAPFGAAYAGLDTVDVYDTGWNPGSIRFVGNAILSATTAYDYFDGDFPADAQFTYAWRGVANQSASIRTASSDLQIIDPDAPVVPAPPQPPVVDDSVILDDIVWDRYVALIPAASIHEWIDSVPTLALFTNFNDERQVRIRYYSNPPTIDPTAWTDGGVDPDFEQIISYIPDNATFTLDGVAQRAWVEYADGPFAGAQIAADTFLYGEGGGPSEWPALLCGVNYMLTLDVPIGATPNNLTPVLNLTDRLI
jgi:hypothetical protein